MSKVISKYLCWSVLSVKKVWNLLKGTYKEERKFRLFWIIKDKESFVFFN